MKTIMKIGLAILAPIFGFTVSAEALRVMYMGPRPYPRSKRVVSVTGKVIDAKTGKAIENIRLTLLGKRFKTSCSSRKNGRYYLGDRKTRNKEYILKIIDVDGKANGEYKEQYMRLKMPSRFYSTNITIKLNETKAEKK